MFLLLAIMTSSFVACKKDDSIDPNGENVTNLSFKAASGYDYLKALDGYTDETPQNILAEKMAEALLQTKQRFVAG